MLSFVELTNPINVLKSSSLSCHHPINDTIINNSVINDRIDQQLIGLLQANARTSTADLARKLGVARTTVIARIQRLERQGVITGYTVRLSAHEGEQGVQAFVSLSVSPKQARQVIQRLSQFVELRQLAAVSGEFDYLAILRAATPQRLDQLLDEIGEIEGVQRTTTSVLLAMRVDRVA